MTERRKKKMKCQYQTTRPKPLWTAGSGADSQVRTRLKFWNFKLAKLGNFIDIKLAVSMELAHLSTDEANKYWTEWILTCLIV